MYDSKRPGGLVYSHVNRGGGGGSAGGGEVKVVRLREIISVRKWLPGLIQKRKLNRHQVSLPMFLTILCFRTDNISFQIIPPLQ